MKSITQFFTSVKQRTKQMTDKILSIFYNVTAVINKKTEPFYDYLFGDENSDSLLLKYMDKLTKLIRNFRKKQLVYRINIFIGIAALISLVTSIKFNIPHLKIGAYVLAGLLAIQYIFPTLLIISVCMMIFLMQLVWHLILLVLFLLHSIVYILIWLVLKTLTYPIALLITIVGYPTLYLLDITGIKKQGN